MLLKKGSIYWCLFLFSVLIIACSGGSGNKNESVARDSVGTQSALKDSINSSAMAFALPAPLQIATVLKEMEIPFSEKLLVSEKKTRVYSSDYSRALNLGVYITDLGYSTVFGEKQTTLNYYSTVNNLLNDMHISANINLHHFKRFQDNIDNTDSLCSIILRSFGQWQSYFQENKREEDGLYILSGTYVEGLYLTMSNPAIRETEVFKNLIGQQKLFLDNLLELSNYIDKKPDFDDLYLKLGELDEAYAKIMVSVKTDPKGKTSIICNYTQEQLALLSSKVNQIRNEIINPSGNL